MKKLLLLFISLVICFTFAGCFTKDSSGTDITDSGTVNNSSTSSPVQSNTKSEELDEAGIRTLITENLNCMENIFQLGSLPTQGSPLRENIYQVDTTKYKNYEEFANYIKSVYSADAAKNLLENYPYEGDPKYINADGKLCINMDHQSAKGYFVDWTDYKVEITKSDSTSCEFKLTAKIEEPAENPQKEDYIKNAKAVLENGKWLLMGMVY